MVKRSYHLWPYLLVLSVLLYLILDSLYAAYMFVRHPVPEAQVNDDIIHSDLVFAGFVALFTLYAVIALVSDIAHNRRRQWAAGTQQEQVRLATDQPEPSASLAFPLVLQRSLSWYAIFFIPVLFSTAMFCLFAVSILAFPQPEPESFSAILGIIVILMPISFGVPFVMMGIVAVFLRQKVIVTESGITQQIFGFTRTIHWNEARLFSLPHLTFYAGPHRRSHYELSSSDAIIRWSYRSFLPRNNWFWHIRTNMPADEYDRAIDALNRYVVARTGLPLYDLRS